MDTQININNTEWASINVNGQLYSVNKEGLLHNLRKNTYTYGYKDTNGHLQFEFENGKRKMAHRVEWEAFNGKIPKGYDVHHINHIKTDNRLENLVLMKTSDHHKLHIKEIINEFNKSAIEVTSKAVFQYTINGDFVAEYKSQAEASRQTGIPQGNISKCCIGERSTAGGFYWKYTA